VREFDEDELLVFARFVSENNSVGADKKYLLTINMKGVLAIWDVQKLMKKYTPS
jgi:hypothetical protein